MLAGNLGGQDRMEFTVVGDSVVLAARLCDEAPPGGVALSEATRTQPGGANGILVSDCREVRIRNRQQPALVHRVISLAPGHAERLQAILNSLFPGSEAPA